MLVTIFVNPLQFGPAEDFDRYPRPLDADLEVCAAEGVAAVFAPDRREMYPQRRSGHRRPGPGRAGARRRIPAGLLRRRADRRAEAVPADPPGHRGVRPRRTPSSWRSSGRWWPTWTWACGSRPWPRCATPTAWPPRAGTPTCPPRTGRPRWRSRRRLAAGRDAAAGGPGSVLSAARRVLGLGQRRAGTAGGLPQPGASRDVRPGRRAALRPGQCWRSPPGPGPLA